MSKRLLPSISHLLRTQNGAASKAKIAFISGPIEADNTYFESHYLPALTTAISQSHSFVLGAAKGIDTLAFRYLLSSGISPSKVTIYLANHQRAWQQRYTSFEARGGKILVVGRNHVERDEACTKASHYDILRYRVEEEARLLFGQRYRPRISGTEKNERRRKSGVGLVWVDPLDKNRLPVE
jgi:hypothetical protein